MISLDFSGEYLAGCAFSFADLEKANLNEACLYRSKIKEANLEGTNLEKANLEWADLSATELKEANLYRANLYRSNLSEDNLEGANLTGTNLTGANLTGVVGLGTKEGEIEFANKLLSILKSGKGKLAMRSWHTCETTHCIAGWYAPNIKSPGSLASRALPTLARYFLSTEEEALEALKRVAEGKDSVFN